MFNDGVCLQEQILIFKWITSSSNGLHSEMSAILLQLITNYYSNSLQSNMLFYKWYFCYIYC